ncbi:hypothetical protein VKT23_013406 [Stygiomarasmius scandens]|uniref:Uncharacterized protein n=1 Tax=Marasmiellus scandens TaxID=2682957 RepID=A0ABR1J4K7_9AGAR
MGRDNPLWPASSSPSKVQRTPKRRRETIVAPSLGLSPLLVPPIPETPQKPKQRTSSVYPTAESFLNQSVSGLNLDPDSRRSKRQKNLEHKDAEENMEDEGAEGNMEDEDAKKTSKGIKFGVFGKKEAPKEGIGSAHMVTFEHLPPTARSL